MALQYPGYTVPQPTTTRLTDVVDGFDQSFRKGRERRQEADAPAVFEKSLPPLQEFGLPEPGTLREMFANPNTRAMAIDQVRAAQARRDEANDPMRKLQLEKVQLDIAAARRGPAGPGPTSEMRNFQFSQQNPGFAEFIGKAGAQNAPAEVQTYLFYRNQAQQAGEQPVSFLEFKQNLKEKPAGGTPSPTIAKEIFEADESIQAGQSVIGALGQALTLNETAWDGPAADIGTQAGALFGDANSANTQEMKNLVTAQALDQLKATFGGMPTEGERKILLDIQGSVTQPREVRKRIFERALKAAERRVEFNRARATALRNGQYFDAEFSLDGAAPSSSAAPAPGAGIDDILGKYGL